ncbi:MAG TPA: D-aminoacyl-tRNA deacylase [Spirochaetota bacterium]|nr:D-aminoacyl-tRNA deacylase [Spirochaetota bacterium]HPJ35456.1 D-aminoacyl-tRNA deacylase [Spirochaetota bacterium]
MRAVVQRIEKASVTVDGEIIASAGNGLLILVGFHGTDTDADSDYIISKSINLRIFEDSAGLMNLSVSDIEGEILVVSQFTLYGDARKGRRPSFSESMPPAEAEKFYDNFLGRFREKYGAVKSGKFGAYMDVSLVNSGPVTILLDSRKQF